MALHRVTVLKEIHSVSMVLRFHRGGESTIRQKCLPRLLKGGNNERKAERPWFNERLFSDQKAVSRKPVSVCHHLSVEIKIFPSSLQLKTKLRNKLQYDVAVVRQLSATTWEFRVRGNTFVLLINLPDFYVKDLHAHNRRVSPAEGLTSLLGVRGGQRCDSCQVLGGRDGLQRGGRLREHWAR